jgi:dCMP deaminase
VADAQERKDFFKWDLRYLNLAQEIAGWSKDPSSKVGTVIVGRDRRKIALGYNGFPPGIADDHRLEDRDAKYILVQHAERNALDNAEFDVRGGTLVTTKHPCHECAKSIVSRGIARVVCPPNDMSREPWASSGKGAAAIFKEAGVELALLPHSTIQASRGKT